MVSGLELVISDKGATHHGEGIDILMTGQAWSGNLMHGPDAMGPALCYPLPRPPMFASYAALDRRIWVMAIARAVNTMGLSLVMAFLAVYLVEERGATGLLYGGLLFVANAFQSAAQAWAGAYSDRVGRRRLMIGALYARAVLLVALGLEIEASVSMWLFAPTLVVNAMLRGCFEPVAYALVADVVTAKDRVRAFGLQRMGTNLGWAMGPALGGALTHWLSFGQVFMIAAIILVGAAVLTSTVTETRVRTREQRTRAATVGFRASVRESWSDPLMRRLAITTWFFALAHAQLFATLSVYVTEGVGLDKASLGLLYMINGLAVVLLQLPAVRLVDSKGLRFGMVAGAVLYVAAFMIFGAATGIAVCAAGVITMTVGEVIFAPAHQTAVATIAPQGRVGSAFGLIGLVQVSGIAVAPIFGGLAFDIFLTRPHIMWASLAIFPVGMVVAAARWPRRTEAAEA